MFRLLLLSVAISACIAKEDPQVTQETLTPQESLDPQATVSPEPYRTPYDTLHQVEEHRLREGLARLRGDLHRHHDGRRRDYDRHYPSRPQDDRRHGDGPWYEPRDDRYDHEEPEGPVILRSIKPEGHGHPDIARQNKIIEDVYSPDYAERTWVLDYRYLKTGGRDYTRGPGGQIIILPKGIRSHEHKEFKNYDDLIEHLRQKNLAERKKPRYFMPLGEESRDEPEYLREHHEANDYWRHNE